MSDSLRNYLHGSVQCSCVSHGKDLANLGGSPWATLTHTISWLLRRPGEGEQYFHPMKAIWKEWMEKIANHRITQNCRMVEAGRDLWRSSGPAPCSSRTPQSQLPRTMSGRLLNILKEADFTTSIGSLRQCLVTCTVKKCFLMFQWKMHLCILEVVWQP